MSSSTYNTSQSETPPATLEFHQCTGGVRRRRGRLPKISKRPNDVLNRERVYMSTWEGDEPRIDKIYKDVGGWKGTVTWSDLKINEYPVATLYTRCPQKVRYAIQDRKLSTDCEQVFSYYEREICRLRAKGAIAGGSAREQVHESTSESSTPQTPAIASQPPQRWRAPEADMYGRNNSKSLPITKSGRKLGQMSVW